MAENEAETTVLAVQFKAVFGTMDHPLYTKLRADLCDGRTLSAVLADLREAEAHRARESTTDDLRLYIASL